MPSLNNIVPWKCHICNVEFDKPHGGICSRCSKATCRDHLHQLGAKKLDATWVCQACLTSEEKTKKRVKWKTRLSNLSFKRIAAIIRRRA